MISPENFYDEIKEKGATEIEKEIRSLKRTINRLKDEIERPDSEPDMVCPSRETVLFWTREYLTMAKKALAEAGWEYHETAQERRQRMFLEELAGLRRMEFEIGGFFCGVEHHEIIVDGEHVHHAGIVDGELLDTRDQLLKCLHGMHLEEWRKYYSPERYGMHILDGTHWELKLEYENQKQQKYSGSNVYPWNFRELCQMFDVEWSRPA